MENKKVNRKGVFVGGYVPMHVKEFVQRRAKIQHKTASQILKEILIKEIAGGFATEKPKKLEEKAFQLICKICSIKFFVTAEWQKNRLKNKSSYFCPNGHRHIYSAEED